MLGITLSYAIIKVYELHETNNKLYASTGNRFNKENVLLTMFLFLALMEILLIIMTYNDFHILSDNIMQISSIIISLSNLLIANKANSIERSLNRFNQKILEVQKKSLK